MSTEQETDEAPEPREPSDGRPEAQPEAQPGERGQEQPRRQPDWWHRDHPTFTALTGFFTGLAFVILVPGLFIAILHVFFDEHTAEDLFPFVLVTLAVPLGLMVVPRTRRFGAYMLIGALTTALVVVGVAALVLWYMITYEG